MFCGILRDLAPPGGRQTDARDWFSANATPPTRHGKGRTAALYVPEDAARRFLTAKGHHDEQVETLLRRALALGAVSQSDKEE